MGAEWSDEGWEDWSGKGWSKGWGKGWGKPCPASGEYSSGGKGKGKAKAPPPAWGEPWESPPEWDSHGDACYNVGWTDGYSAGQAQAWDKAMDYASMFYWKGHAEAKGCGKGGKADSSADGAWPASGEYSSGSGGGGGNGSDAGGGGGGRKKGKRSSDYKKWLEALGGPCKRE